MPQFRRDILTNTLFQIDRPIEHFPLIRRPGSDAYPRRIQRGLRIILERQHVEQDLHVSLRLHVSAHDAVHGVQIPVTGVGDKSRDDGMIWSLPWREDVGVIFDEGEIRAAVLKGETTSFGDDAGAEAGVIAVDEGGGVTVFVGYGEVDGVA